MRNRIAAAFIALTALLGIGAFSAAAAAPASASVTQMAPNTHYWS